MRALHAFMLWTGGSLLPGIIMAALLTGFQPRARAAVLQFDSPQLFEKSVTEHLRLSEDGAEIELEAGELFEDDGPASGHSYQKPKNQELVAGDVWIKKE